MGGYAVYFCFLPKRRYCFCGASDFIGVSAFVVWFFSYGLCSSVLILWVVFDFVVGVCGRVVSFKLIRWI